MMTIQEHACSSYAIMCSGLSDAQHAPADMHALPKSDMQTHLDVALSPLCLGPVPSISQANSHKQRYDRQQHRDHDVARRHACRAAAYISNQAQPLLMQYSCTSETRMHPADVCIAMRVLYNMPMAQQ